MNISKRDQKLLLILLGLAIFLISYLGVSRSFKDKQATVQTQIDSLSPRLEELRGFYANLSTYQDEIDRIQSSVTKELSSYPNDVRSEDIIMYATALEKDLGISVEGITLSNPELVSQFAVPKKTGDTSEFVPVAAVRTGVKINCILNYEQLKKLVAYVYDGSKKTTITDVSVSFDQQTGMLIGIISLNKYFITSSDYVYTPTDIPAVEQGTADPFGTFAVTTAPTDTGATN